MPPRTRTPAPAEDAKPPAPETAATATPPEPEPDTGGWFRNTGETELTVLGDGVTAVLAPGRITPLGRTPTHRDLESATEADFQAQQRADAAAAAEAAEPADAVPPTDETEA